MRPGDLSTASNQADDPHLHNPHLMSNEMNILSDQVINFNQEGLNQDPRKSEMQANGS